jgi:hypothetical protein
LRYYRERWAQQPWGYAFSRVGAKPDNVHVRDLGNVGQCFRGGDLGVCDENDCVTLMDQMCRWAVDAYDAGPPHTGNRIGFEARPIGDVDDRYELARQDVGCLKEVKVYSDRADIVQIRVGDRGT